MVEYIKELISTIRTCRQMNNTELAQRFGDVPPDIARLLEGVAEELDRLNPRDFEPRARHDFVVHRATLRTLARSQRNSDGENEAVRRAEKIGELLDAYAGEGSRAKMRDFSFVTDPDVRKIVGRDYRELVLRAFPDGSWKSTVILAGSILEAVLYDMLTTDAAAVASAMGSCKAPRKSNNGPVKDITKHARAEQWSLNDLIKVACDLKLLPHKDEQAIHLVLRDYRNFVHPRLEIAMDITIAEGHATAAKGMLDVILDHLSA
jgi:hypothetical protein